MFDYFIDIWREHHKKIFAFALFIDEPIWRKPVENIFQMEFMGTRILYEYNLRKTKDYNYKEYLDQTILSQQH